jgi:MATE family multidrug resistance protein
MLLVSPLSALLNYIFINSSKLGSLGAPLATGLSYWISFGLLVLYTSYISGHECW